MIERQQHSASKQVAESDTEKMYRFKKKEELWEMTSSANADVLLAGNTHTAFHIMLDQQEHGYTIYRPVINPGFVGCPKDGS